MTQRLTAMAIDKVSLVDHGANGRPFAILKRHKEGSMTTPLTAQAAVGALAAGIAKARSEGAKPGLLATLRKALSPAPTKVRKSAAGMVSQATWALSTVLDLITAESADVLDLITAESADLSDDAADPDAAEDAADLTNLKAIAQGLTTYIASTAQEVGTPDDLEDIAEEAAAYAAMCAGEYGVWKANRPIAKAGKKISAARLNELRDASDKLLAVIADAEADDKSTKTEEEPVEKAELIAAIGEAVTKANEPIVKRLEAIEKAAGAPAGDPPEDGGEPVTLDTIAEAVGKIADRLSTVENGANTGHRTSLSSQDGAGDVKKRSVFAGMF